MRIKKMEIQKLEATVKKLEATVKAQEERMDELEDRLSEFRGYVDSLGPDDLNQSMDY